MRHLDLFQVVDADRIAVPLARQEDLDEISGNTEFMQGAFSLKGMQTGELERCRFGLAARYEVGVENALGHLREGEMAQGMTDMASRIAALETASEDLIQSGAGHHTQLPKAGYGLGQVPIGYGGAHSTLDNFRYSGAHIGTVCTYFSKKATNNHSQYDPIC